MTIKHIRIFIAVYEALSFTKAGERLHLAQPSVSLAIRELENYYQVTLFDRIKHSVYPTEHGVRLYNYGTHILSLFEEMEKSVTDWKTQSTLRIGSSITIGNSILPSLIKLFKKSCPEVEIRVIINNSSAIENDILQNRIDFALIENEPAFDKLVSSPFMTDSLCTIAHPGHSLANKKQITLKQISRECFLMREHGSSVRELVESIFLMEQISIQPAWESTSTQALINAVESNLGITTLPYQLARPRAENGSVVLLDVPLLNLKRHYNIIYYKNKYLSKTVLDFFKLCKRFGAPPLP